MSEKKPSRKIDYDKYPKPSRKIDYNKYPPVTRFKVDPKKKIKRK